MNFGDLVGKPSPAVVAANETLQAAWALMARDFPNDDPVKAERLLILAFEQARRSAVPVVTAEYLRDLYSRLRKSA